MSLSLRRILRTNRNAEDPRSSLEDDRPPSYTVIDTMALTHSGSADSPNDRAWNVSVGPHSAMLPDETEPSLMDIFGAAETSDSRYSKRPSGKFKFCPPTSHLCEFISILPDLC